MGNAPFTNEDLKKLASAGSCFFDTLYYQVSAMYRLQTTKNQHLPAPNNSLGILYNLIVARAPDMLEIGSKAASSIATGTMKAIVWNTCTPVGRKRLP